MTTPARHWLWLTAPLLALAAGCGPSDPPSGLGDRYEVGQGELYCSPEVSPLASGIMAAELQKEEGFNSHPWSAQVRYRNRRYEARFVVRAGSEATSPARGWRALGERLSARCFDGSPVDVHLCDERFTTLRVIPFEPIRPDLPVRVTVRPSVGGGSLVAQYRNDSGKYLAVRVGLRNPTTNQSREVVINIPPYGMTEHGWAEGWSYRSGERVTVSHADYETAELVVP